MGKNDILKCFLIKSHAEFGSKVLFFQCHAGLLGSFYDTLDQSHVQ